MAPKTMILQAPPEERAPHATWCLSHPLRCRINGPMSVPLILLALAPTGPACAGAIAGVEPPLDSNQASIVVDVDGPAVPYDPMIFGGFIEHLGKQIYGGFFDPGSPLADSAGFRLDVIEAVRELKVPVIRWPGGCFVDSYHWNCSRGAMRSPTILPVNPEHMRSDPFLQGVASMRIA